MSTLHNNGFVDDGLTLRSPFGCSFSSHLNPKTGTNSTSFLHAEDEPQQNNVSVAADDVVQAQHHHHDALLRPLVSALLVGAEVLQLHLETRFTAAVLLHRYYAAIRSSASSSTTAGDGAAVASEHDDDDDDWNYVVAVCLFLACKREEEPRRLRDVINLAHMIDIITRSTSASSIPSSASASTAAAAAQTTTTKQNQQQEQIVLQWNPTPPPLDDTYWAAKERMVQTEQRVLRWLAFDIAVSHPHRAVVLMLMMEDEDEQQEEEEDRHERLGRLRSAAFCRLNDALFSIAALQQPVLALAVAALTLASLPAQRVEQKGEGDSSSSPSSSLLLHDDPKRWHKAAEGLDERTRSCIRPAMLCLQSATNCVAAAAANNT